MVSDISFLLQTFRLDEVGDGEVRDDAKGCWWYVGHCDKGRCKKLLGFPRPAHLEVSREYTQKTSTTNEKKEKTEYNVFPWDHQKFQRTK